MSTNPLVLAAAANLVTVESAVLQLTRLRHEALASVVITTQDGAVIHFDLSDTPTAVGNQALIEAGEHYYQRMWEVLWDIVAENPQLSLMSTVQALRAE